MGKKRISNKKSTKPVAKNHVCPECERTFDSERALKQHAHVHNTVKPFVCKVCSRAYTQQTSLSRHIRFNPKCAPPKQDSNATVDISTKDASTRSVTLKAVETKTSACVNDGNEESKDSDATILLECEEDKKAASHKSDVENISSCNEKSADETTIDEHVNHESNEKDSTKNVFIESYNSQNNLPSFNTLFKSHISLEHLNNFDTTSNTRGQFKSLSSQVNSKPILQSSQSCCLQRSFQASNTFNFTFLPDYCNIAYNMPSQDAGYYSNANIEASLVPSKRKCNFSDVESLASTNVKRSKFSIEALLQD